MCGLFEQTPAWFDFKISPCTRLSRRRKQAESKIKLADRERDGRRATRLISAANAWLILAHGIRQLEVNAEVRQQSGPPQLTASFIDRWPLI
jgi:hypothetical protein